MSFAVVGLHFLHKHVSSYYLRSSFNRSLRKCSYVIIFWSLWTVLSILHMAKSKSCLHFIFIYDIKNAFPLLLYKTKYFSPDLLKLI